LASSGGGTARDIGGAREAAAIGRSRAAWSTRTSMSRTIVHADDSASVRRWVAEQLSDPDLKVVSVADGEAALHLLRESPCDLLLTDLEMPNLDGLALVAAVRDLPMHRFLPVLVLSCRQPGEFDARARHGVTGWLVKPVEPENLRRWIRRLLPR
jgi:two-component system, chemotaxis family, chemotaxis protein CheY